jgi:hypothetical protein
MTIFCLRDNFVPPLLTTFARGKRDTAPVPFMNFIYRDYISSVYQACTATPVTRFARTASAPARNQNCIMTAKSTPYLSCHQDNFSAEAPGHVAGWLRQVTQHLRGSRAPSLK